MINSAERERIFQLQWYFLIFSTRLKNRNISWIEMDKAIAESPTLNKCCYCEPSGTKCSSETCPCFSNNLICAEHCDYPKLADFCLNRPITVCQCKAVEKFTDSAPDRSPNRQQMRPRRKSSSQTTRNYNQNLCLGAKLCVCAKFKEACTEQCECKAGCRNNLLPAVVELDERPVVCENDWCQNMIFK